MPGDADDQIAGGISGRHRVDLVAEPFARPEFLAGVRIVALEKPLAADLVAGQRHNEFVAIADLDDDRRAPGAEDRAIDGGLVGLPDGLASALVERDQESLGLARAVEDDEQILVENRAGPVAPARLDCAEVALPELLAGEVIGDDASRREVGKDGFAVGDGGGGAGRILLVRCLDEVARDVLLPELLAVLAIEGDDRAPLAAVESLGEEDAVAPDDGRRVARLWQRHLPAHVLRRAPGEWQVLFRGDAVAARAAPWGPVVSVNG